MHHFTRFDQVNQLVSASEADPDLGFMARLLVLCSLPRSNPGNRSKYVRRNGPYTLGMTAGINTKLPYGNLPRLLLAWVCTEAVRTQSRVLVLGKSLSDFMRALGMEPVGGGATGARTRLRNQRSLVICTPLFPRKQPFPSDRPAAVQGAKQRSGPLTARTDLES